MRRPKALWLAGGAALASLVAAAAVLVGLGPFSTATPNGILEVAASPCPSISVSTGIFEAEVTVLRDAQIVTRRFSDVDPTRIQLAPGVYVAQAVGRRERVVVESGKTTSINLACKFPRVLRQETPSKVPSIAPGGRLLSTLVFADRTCVITPPRTAVAPSIPIGVAVMAARNHGLLMTEVGGRAGGMPRVVAFYGMLQCSTSLPRHRALVWLVEFPNDKILDLNGPCCTTHTVPYIGTMFVVVNPRSGLANQSFGGPGVVS